MRTGWPCPPISPISSRALPRRTTPPGSSPAFRVRICARCFASRVLPYPLPGALPPLRSSGFSHLSLPNGCLPRLPFWRPVGEMQRGREGLFCCLWEVREGWSIRDGDTPPPAPSSPRPPGDGALVQKLQRRGPCRGRQLAWELRPACGFLRTIRAEAGERRC